MLKVPTYYKQFMVWEFAHWTVFVHEQQYYPGRVYLSAHRDFVDAADATDEEVLEQYTAFRIVKDALKSILGPDKFNYAMLANVFNHCHWHVIPRYKSERVITYEGLEFRDANWGGNYAPYDKSVKPPIEWLLKLRDNLRAAAVTTATS